MWEGHKREVEHRKNGTQENEARWYKHSRAKDGSNRDTGMTKGLYPCRDQGIGHDARQTLVAACDAGFLRTSSGRQR